MESGPRLISYKERKKRMAELSKSKLAGLKAPAVEQESIRKDSQNVTLPPEEEKSKLLQSFSSDELLRKFKQKIGKNVIFIDLEDYKQKSGDTIYGQSKKKVLTQLKEQGTESDDVRNDERTEEMLRDAIQDTHKKLLVEKASEYQAQISDLRTKLQEAISNYQVQLERARSDEQIAKSKGQLLSEINELTAANKRLQEIVDHLNLDIKQQTDKFRENEKVMREKIVALESQVKCTQTEQFAKLREDNKRLVQENLDMREELNKLRERNKTMTLNFERMSRDEELIKNSLLKELEELQTVRSNLNNEEKRMDLEKAELEIQKKSLIKQSMYEESKRNSDKQLRTEQGVGMMDALSKAQMSGADSDSDVQAPQSATSRMAKSRPRKLVKKKTLELRYFEDEIGGELSEDVIADMRSIKESLERCKEKRKGSSGTNGSQTGK